MTQLAELETRVTRLEERMDDVHDLAGRADQEVAGWRTTLNNHTNTINALGDQIDARFDQVDARFDRVESEMRNSFAKVDENFRKVEEKFALLHRGQEQITKLLTRHLGPPPEEIGARDADG